jgi:hypothetical protein
MATRYWVGGTGTWDALSTANWSTSSGGASGASAPLAVDTVIFDSASGTGTCTAALGATCAIATLNSSTLGLTLGANLTMTGTFTLTLGALSLGSSTLSCNVFSSNNSNTRSIAFGTGNITLVGNNTTIWVQSTATGFTYTGTPTVNSTYSGATGTRTITTGGTAGGSAATALNFAFSAGTDTVSVGGGGHVNNLNFTGFAGTLAAGARVIYGDLTIASGMTLTAGTQVTTFAATSGTKTITTAGKTIDNPITFNGVGGTWAFADALTQGSTRAFTLTNGTVRLKSSATSTVGVFATSGTNQKYLQSTTPGTQATLSQASGTVDASYLTIQDISATGGATWNAYVDQNNVDAGNVDGWDFGVSPVVGSAEYTYRIRSFTEPRRF